MAGKRRAGGVLQTDKGKVFKDYSENLGHCSITRAEFWGVIYEMEMAWRLGVRWLEIRVDFAVWLAFSMETQILAINASLIEKF
ncbi:hypothetical protein LINGRAHAP2_LOCUS20024 [Linum grandiflorum]